MKVLLHCLYYTPEVGGLESHVAGLAEELVVRGHPVRVITSRSRPELPFEEERRGVQIFRTEMASRTPRGWAAFAIRSVGPTREHARWADLLHAQTFASVVPVRLAAGRAGGPWVASFHTSHFLSRAGNPLWRPVLRRLVRWPDHALAASREIAEVASSLAPGTRVEAITNGVDTELFRPADPGSALEVRDEPTLIVPRRLFGKNGVEHLVRALPAIRDAIPGVRVRIVGDGPERVPLDELAHGLGVSEVVRFEGAVPHREMPGLLGEADLAVFPSLMEATSVAALEAMACGVPVVATDVGGLPEIVDATVGALVPPADPAALAREVVRLLGSGDLPAMGRTARTRVVGRWSNARLVDRHLEIYEDLLAGRPVREPSIAEATR